MSEKSLVEYAYDVLSKEPKEIKFKVLFDKALALSGLENLSEAEMKKRMSSLYTQLSLDGRFVTLTDNTWDLRSRHTFDQVHIDMTDAYSDVEQSTMDDEERKALDDELGNDSDENDSEESDDLDFDKQKSDKETEEF